MQHLYAAVRFGDYYNAHRVHRALAGSTPVQRAGALSAAPAALDHYAWQQHCRGLFQTPIAA
jgi:putative transposase